MIQNTIKINAAVFNEWLKDLGLSSSDIAEYLTIKEGISTDETSVDDWRKGRANPSAEQAEVVAKILNISWEELTGETTSENDETFEELLQRVIREERNGTFPASHKNKGLLLPGLSKVMNDRGVGAQYLARSMGLDTRTVNRYMNGQRGVPIEKLQQLAYVLCCLPKNLTTYKNLAFYHSAENSRSNSTLVTNPRLQQKADYFSSQGQSKVNTSGNGRADNGKVVLLEEQIRDLTERNSELQSTEKKFQSIEATLKNIETSIANLEEEFESVKNMKSQGFFSKIFG